MKCLVFECSNETHQGTFVGSLCLPCHSMVTAGVIGHGRTWIHRLDAVRERAEVRASAIAEENVVLTARGHALEKLVDHHARTATDLAHEKDPDSEREITSAEDLENTLAIGRELVALREVEKAARARFAEWTRDTYAGLSDAFAKLDAARRKNDEFLTTDSVGQRARRSKDVNLERQKFVGAPVTCGDVERELGLDSQEAPVADTRLRPASEWTDDELDQFAREWPTGRSRALVAEVKRLRGAARRPDNLTPGVPAGLAMTDIVYMIEARFCRIVPDSIRSLIERRIQTAIESVRPLDYPLPRLRAVQVKLLIEALAQADPVVNDPAAARHLKGAIEAVRIAIENANAPRSDSPKDGDANGE